MALATIVSAVGLQAVDLGGTRATAIWTVAGAALGLVIAGLAVAIPAIRDARALSVAAARRTVGRAGVPCWLGRAITVTLLVAAGFVAWWASRPGYQLVLAVEGVPTVSVTYWALIGPLLLWVGAGLLAWQVVEAVLRRRRGAVRWVVGPIAGRLSGTVAASMQRQRRLLARSVALLALAVASAICVAVFNATYRHQSEIDALLSNGADVTVSASPGSSPATDLAAALGRLPGVRRVEAVAHRYAYVGTDLQDLYGVDPTTITTGPPSRTPTSQADRHTV